MGSLTRRLAPTSFKSSKPKIKSSKNLSIANATALTEKMSLVFSEIEDPPVERTPVHFLTDILIIGILSVIAGGKGWEDMENFGLSKYDWLEQFLALPEGIPSADTFRRWVESIVEAAGAQVILIDGKTLKGSYDREQGKSALHLVSAWSIDLSSCFRTSKTRR